MMNPYQWIDTHCHLVKEGKNSDPLEFEEEHILDIEKNLTCALTIGTNERDNKGVFHLAEKHSFLYGAVGHHPYHIQEYNSDLAKHYKQKILDSKGKIVAIGEIGLDYYKCDVPESVQQKGFEQQLQLAYDLESFPVIVHSREAVVDTLAILKNFPFLNNVVFHCFTGTKEEAKNILNQGYFLSFTGAITFPNNSFLRDIVELTPLEKMMIETDSPYLAPQPHRGQKNSPAFVKYVGETVASIKKLSIEDVQAEMHSNTDQFFNLQLPS